MISSSLGPAPTSLGPAPSASLFDLAKVVTQIDHKLFAVDKRALESNRLFPAAPSSTSRAYNPSHSPIDTLSMKPLPEFLLRQIDNAECKCFMGIFPEIHRVWLTVDHRLFLWNYIDNSDFYSFEGMTEVIITVGLARPKKGVFESHVKHVIVLVTNAEIRLLGASLDAAGNLSMYLTDISASTDDIVMLSMADTENGQIFLGGRDGNLYELEYEAEESWFRRRCTLINHTRSSLTLFMPTFLSFSEPDPIIGLAVDRDRKILYTLTGKSVIHGFQLDVNLAGDRYVPKSFCQRKLVEDASRLTQRTPGVHGEIASFRGISIHVEKPTYPDHRDVSLVAVTQGGHRVYYHLEYRGQDVLAFHALHVRATPPAEKDPDMHAFALPLAQFDTALYSQGMFIAAGSSNRGTNAQLFCSLDVGSIIVKHQFTEFYQIASNNERVWAVEEVENDDVWQDMNDLATQVSSFSRQFHILTNHGLYMTVQRRPIDMLVSVLVQSQGRESEALLAFFDNYTPDQVCAMCLALACENPFAYKALPDGVFNADAQLKSWAWQLFFRHGAKVIPANPDAGSRFGMGPEMYDNLSVAYNAILLYFGRLLEPTWTLYLAEFKNTPSMSQQLLTVAENLTQLRGFIPFYVKNVQSMSPEERQAMQMLLQTLEFFIQGLHFLLLILPSDIGSLLQRVPESMRALAKKITLSSLITSPGGLDLIKELAKIVMNDIIQRNTHIDTICESLKDKCQLFFNANDLKIFKASELLQRAHLQESDPYTFVEESLRLLLESAVSIPPSQLQTFCASFQGLGFPEAAIQLAVSCARAADPDDLALSLYFQENAAYWKPEQAGILSARLECYNCAFAVIDEAVNRLIRETTTEALESAYRKSPIFRQVLGSKDEYFHYLFYDHMLEKKQLVYLLKLPDAEYLEKYLERKQYEKSEYGHYLCLLYRNARKYEQAVRKLHEFAISDRFPATLEKRIELLSVALSIVESKLARGIEPELTGELQDLLDVANVQWEIKKVVAGKPEVEGYVPDFDVKLFNVSELYEIADELALPECKLSIFQVSGHRDTNLLLNVWRQIMAAEPTLDAKINKLIALGTKFRHSEIAFPLAVMVNMLEANVFSEDQDVPTAWLMNALRTIGYSYYEIYNVYDKLFVDKLPPFHHGDGSVFLLGRLLELTKLWLEEATTRDRLSFDARLVDACVAKYLGYLSTGNDPARLSMLQEFQAIERKVRTEF